MSEVKIIGRGVDTLVLNVCYADKPFLPIKQEMAKGCTNEDSVLLACYPLCSMLCLSISVL